MPKSNVAKLLSVASADATKKSCPRLFLFFFLRSSVCRQSFHGPGADAALFDTLVSELRDGIEVRSWDCEINDPGFAKACAEALLHNLRT
jgi:hypothetical protein